MLERVQSQENIDPHRPAVTASARIPENIRVYAIGDIHGYPEALDRMHEEIAADLIRYEHRGEVHIVYLGDYIDRGPDSKGVIDRLIARRDRGDGIEKTFLLGNHETGFLDFMKDPHSTNWLDFGGVETLRSYGLAFTHNTPLPAEIEQAAEGLKSRVPGAHLEFLHTLDLHVEIGDYLFVHAGIDPHKSIEDQTLKDLTFIREPFLSWPEPLSHRVVHGHTKVTDPEVTLHRIGIDTGLYEGGHLTCAVLEREDVRFLQVK